MIMDTDDQHTIDQLKAILDAKTPKSDIWEEWDDEVRSDVEEALAEFDRGEGIPHEEVMRKFEKWRKK